MDNPTMVYVYCYPSDTSVTIIPKVNWIKLEVGGVATDFTPAPLDTIKGTSEGDYMGTLVWNYDFPSPNFNDYTWNKVKGEKGD